MGLSVGEPFPAVTLPDLEGRARSLAELWAQGPALIAIGHRDCKTTRQTLPYVDRLFRGKAPEAAVTVILQDDPKTARRLIKEQGLTVPVLLEADPYPLASDLALEVVPTLYAVSAGGRIESSVEGFDRRALEAMARHIGLAGSLFDSADKAPPFRPG